MLYIEFKKVNKHKGESLEEACKAALGQIREKGYRSDLAALGIGKVLELGISFRGKEVLVMSRGMEQG